jgi:Polyketide cyclase / dehydrase and lipid transport
VHFFESHAQITANPSQVWNVLVAAGDWPNWESGVLEVTGAVTLGKKLAIRSSAAPAKAFPVKVTTFDPPTTLVFSNGNFIFKGVRTYTLEAKDGGTFFKMREEYTGAFLEQIWKSIPDLQPSFETFASGLKKKVEGA